MEYHLMLLLLGAVLTAGGIFKRTNKEAADVCDGSNRPVLSGNKIRHLKPSEVFWTNYTQEWNQFMDILYIPPTSPIISDSMTCPHWAVVTGSSDKAFLARVSIDIEAFLEANLNKLVTFYSPCMVYVTVINDDIDSIKALEKKYSGRFKVVDLAYVTELGKAIDFVKMMLAHSGNSHALRNIGYMYAMLHGARTIADMHLDLRLREGSKVLQLPRDSLLSPSPGVQVRKMRHGTDSHKEPSALRYEADMYSMIGASDGPLARGGGGAVRPPPHNASSSASSASSSPLLLLEEEATIESSTVYVLVSLIDEPASERKQSNLEPFSGSIMLPKGLYAPYKARASVHFYGSFWTMFIPVALPGAEADVIRSYVAERLAQDIVGAHILFAIEPLFERTARADAAAMGATAEQALQSRMHLLARKLREFRPSGRCPQSRVEELYVLLYELGFIEHRDFLCLSYWLRAFFAVKVTFPTLKAHV